MTLKYKESENRFLPQAKHELSLYEPRPDTLDLCCRTIAAGTWDTVVGQSGTW